MGEGEAVSAASTGDGTEAAFAAARALLERAQADAARVRFEADQYVHQREQEAAVLVAKARRVLRAAEEKAAVIIAAARCDGPDGSVRTVDVRDGAGADEEIGRVIAPGAARLGQERHPSHGGSTRLDRLLASAITSAVDDTFAGRASA